mmetsp:Transcript_8608/g.14547  ORF Transcript_8608/g.14547 Transcript_8608/m.14547 type:complete len:209 (-) Transcript_8608:107-733(-)
MSEYVLSSLAKNNSLNNVILKRLLNDFDKRLNQGTVQLPEIYYVVRAMHCFRLLDSEHAKLLISYIVKRGYDSDSLLELSSKRGGHRRGLLLIEIFSQASPDIKNKKFLNSVQLFAQDAYLRMQPLQMMRLGKALKKCIHLRNSKISQKVSQEVTTRYLTQVMKSNQKQREIRAKYQRESADDLSDPDQKVDQKKMRQELEDEWTQTI